MARKLFFIINPAAGSAALQRWRQFEAILRRRALQFARAVTTRAGEAMELAREAAGKHDVIVAVGGDGTVFEVINGVMMSGTSQPALAIVPFGTGNDSAHAANIHNENDALHALTAGGRREIDLIKIQCRNGDAPLERYAMLFASVGISSDLLRYTTSRVKRLCGRRLSYIVGLLLALRRYSSGEMKITCDGQNIQNRFIFAGVSNGETFGGGIRIAPGAALNDGKLNVNLIEAVGRLEALRHLWRLRQGRHTDHPKVRYQPAVSLSIESVPPVAVAADGDLIGHTPAKFRIVPHALALLMPPAES